MWFQLAARWQLGSAFLPCLLCIYFAFYVFYPVSTSTVSTRMLRYDYLLSLNWLNLDSLLVWDWVCNSACLIGAVVPDVWRSCTQPQHCVELLPVRRQDWGSVLFSGWRGEDCGVGRQISIRSWWCVWRQHLQLNYMKCCLYVLFIQAGFI